MMCHVTLTVEPIGGSTLEEYAEACLRVAQSIGTTVKMQHKGVWLLAHPDSHVGEIVMRTSVALRHKDEKDEGENPCQ